MVMAVAARISSLPVPIPLRQHYSLGLGFSEWEQGRLHTTRLKKWVPNVHKQLGELCQLQHAMKRKQRHVSKIDMASIKGPSAVAKPHPGETTTKCLAYQLIQGHMVRWTEARGKAHLEIPTAVLIHGILGAGKNWGSFAWRLAEEFPAWQFLLVDLRCHGDSTLLQKRGPHTVASAAADVLKLVGQLKLIPRVLIGHSFGGKVVLSMVDQAKKPLARPVRVWVLDATPGKVHVGEDDEGHPEELIAALQEMPPVVTSRRAVTDALLRKGFSAEIAQWTISNLRAVKGSTGFSWVFDLNGIADMYLSYEETNLWPVVECVPEGVHIDLLRAERSLHRWHHDDVGRIRAAERMASKGGASVQMHVLKDAGHWVHTDNPDGLFRTLSPSFSAPRFSSYP